MELRAGFAADLLAQGHGCTVVTPRGPKSMAYLEDKLEGLLPRQWT
tara:strand:- start:1117 stop:1254 length:138 start_codon:yes stop_codon:yes gene_type:complete